MQFKKHSEKFLNSHAFLGGSRYSWLNYDDSKLIATYENYLAVQRGTELHELAKMLIRFGEKLPKKKRTLNMYVNDAIGYKMTPELLLVYSENCFGTADAISFNNSTGLLRIHDLKTGATPAKMDQLRIYAALFCLDYGIKPGDIEMELRIYQSNDYKVENPTAEVILPIIDKIIRFDEIIDNLKREEA